MAGNRTTQEPGTNVAHIAQAKRYRAARTVLEPTRPLSDEARSHFDTITSSREAATWTRHDLALATVLARVMVALDVAVERIATEDAIAKTDKGTPVANPAFGVCNSLSTSALNLTRSLGLAAAQRDLNDLSQRKKNIREAEARNALKKGEADGLI